MYFNSFLKAYLSFDVEGDVAIYQNVGDIETEKLIGEALSKIQ